MKTLELNTKNLIRFTLVIMMIAGFVSYVLDDQRGLKYYGNQAGLNNASTITLDDIPAFATTMALKNNTNKAF